MFADLLPAFRLITVMTVLTGLVYPAVVTALAQVAFPRQAHGSLVTMNGVVVGSSLIGQSFSQPEYFHPRPSAAGAGYDAVGLVWLQPGSDQSEAVGPREGERRGVPRRESDLHRSDSRRTPSPRRAAASIRTSARRTQPFRPRAWQRPVALMSRASKR